MLRNYLKIAIRNIARYKGYSLINLVGLSVGLGGCILMLLFVSMENSFDHFHHQADNIYRVNKIVKQESGERTHTAEMPGNFAPGLASDYAEVKEFVRLRPWWNPVLVSDNEQQFLIEQMVFTDSTFFKVFDFELLRGDPATVLSRPLSTVITPSVAERFFGEEDPIGKTLYGLNSMPLTVTGVVKEAPYLSHIQYEMLVSWSTTEHGIYADKFDWMNRWITQAIYMYVVLEDGVDPESVESHFPQFMDKYMTRWKAKYQPYLQPLSQVHLHSAHLRHQFNVRHGNITYVYAFTITAILLLIIACINFINLSTARATRRSREVGMRKVLGAGKNQLVGQFLGESLLFASAAMILALVLVEMVLPAFNEVVQRELIFQPLLDLRLLSVLIGATLIVGLLAGLYPAFVLSGFQPQRSLRPGNYRKGWTARARRVLVLTQFFCSAFLITVTLVVNRQIDLALTADPGFDREQQVVLRIPRSDLLTQKDVFRNELLRSPAIVNASFASGGPGQGTMGFDMLPEGTALESRRAVPTIGVDFEFVKTYGLRISAGRDFDIARGTDSLAIIINKTLASELGWEESLGKKILLGQDAPENLTIIGVVEDFAIGSIHQKIRPLLIYITSRRFNMMTVKLKTDDLAETIGFIGKTWQKFDHKNPFDYSFLDDRFAAFYKAEVGLLRVLGFFAMLTIAVACLGLFGLVTFTAEQRTKEIGIRKVMGATVVQLVSLLSGNFLKLVLIANLLAWPLAWLVMRNWLQNFAYRTELKPEIFILAGLIGLAIALITVSYQALRAATANPVKALRYE